MQRNHEDCFQRRMTSGFFHNCLPYPHRPLYVRTPQSSNVSKPKDRGRHGPFRSRSHTRTPAGMIMPTAGGFCSMTEPWSVFVNSPSTCQRATVHAILGRSSDRRRSSLRLYPSSDKEGRKGRSAVHCRVESQLSRTPGVTEHPVAEILGDHS